VCCLGLRVQGVGFRVQGFTKHHTTS
jgi:hypothetical protein